MDSTYFRHLSDSRYCFSIDESHVLIRLAVSKLCPIDKAEILYGDQFSFSHSRNTLNLEIKYEDQGYLYYQTTVNLYPMRLMYVFKIYQNGKFYYLCETGIFDDFNFDLSFLSAYQFVGENRIDYVLEKPSWKGRIFYQIFPERFAYRKDFLDKAYINTDWYEKNLYHRHGAFLGGDLYGIIDKLDYLEDLGVNALYLTPVHPSMSNHKYDVLDYFEVDPHFGGKEAFKLLIDKAHERGMKVMMDLVFNHCGAYNPIFMDVKQKGKESKYFDWFFIDGDKPNDWPLNYLCFAQARNMPKFNTNNRDLQDYLISVGEYWMRDFGVDGYRLDVSEGVSHDFWIRFKLALMRINPEVMLIGENWLNSESYLGNYQFDGVMNYPFLSCISGFLLKIKDAEGTALHLQQLLMRYKDGHDGMMLNILASHDIQRLRNLVGSKNLTLMGYAIMMFYLGYPMIYYGEEIFMEGGRDPDNRRGMEWNSQEFNSSYNLAFKELIRLRKNEPLATGEISFNADRGLLVINRFNSRQCLSLVCNMTDQAIDVEGKIILSNEYENGLLKPHGFVVIKQK